MNHTSAVSANVDLAGITAHVVGSFASNNSVSQDELVSLIPQVHMAFASLGQSEPEAQKREPAVPVEESIKPDKLICLMDGKEMTMLKRYLNTHYQMTPDQYRAMFNLDADYPMVAPNYAKKRRQLALDIGLGTKTKRGRRKNSDDKASTPSKAASKRKSTSAKKAPKTQAKKKA